MSNCYIPDNTPYKDMSFVHTHNTATSAKQSTNTCVTRQGTDSQTLTVFVGACDHFAACVLKGSKYYNSPTGSCCSWTKLQSHVQFAGLGYICRAWLHL